MCSWRGCDWLQLLLVFQGQVQFPCLSVCYLLPPKFSMFPPALLAYRSGIILIRFELIDLCFHPSLWWDPQFTTCGVHFTMYWSVVLLLLTSYVYTCGLDAFLTKATLKGLALADFTFVHVFFVLCLCRDGFREFVFSKDEIFKRAFVYDGVSCPNVTGFTGR